jgi:hypothetical protein
VWQKYKRRVKMSKSRCLCFKAINRLYGKTEDITNYINELEQQNEDLMDFVKYIVDYEDGRVLSEREMLLNKYKDGK